MNDRFVNSTHRPNRWRVAARERAGTPADADAVTDDLIDALLADEIDTDDPSPTLPIPPQTVSIPDDDPQLAAAVSEAHTRFDEFLTAFAHRTPADQFAIKARFMDDYGREYMWVSVTAVDGQHIYGQLDNDPATVRAIRRGQNVRVPRAGLNDWLFTQGAERVGGFTVKVLERRANGDAA
ncbi:MAG: DUF2314 domain-containing protein [Fimbriiglobus sp.]|nr:DUF2314 domain-containing protein [Fimbriiglobus sp.]